jgi:hypothetical protein
MKKKLLLAAGGLVLALPTSLWAITPVIKIQGPTIMPTAVEACVGATEPSGMTVITFVNHSANTITITNAQLPGITTPVSIPPNGTVTFQIPATQQGVYVYAVDGCQ